MTEFEFHMSPVPSSSRPHTSAGTSVDECRGRDAPAPPSSVRRCGLATASAMSGMTPSRHRRTS